MQMAIFFTGYKITKFDPIKYKYFIYISTEIFYKCSDVLLHQTRSKTFTIFNFKIHILNILIIK